MTDKEFQDELLKLIGKAGNLTHREVLNTLERTKTALLTETVVAVVLDILKGKKKG